MKQKFDIIKPSNEEYDDCITKGICSIPPNVIAIKATILAYLQEFAFYILKVREFGGRNVNIKNNFIENFSTLISNFEYNDESLNSLISSLQKIISETKNTYKNICSENNVEPQFFRQYIKIKGDFSLIELAKQGQKYINKLKNHFTEEQEKWFSLILTIIKSICLYIVELQNFDINIDKYYEEMLHAICPLKLKTMNNKQIIELIKKYSLLNQELMLLLFETRKKEFGELEKTEISLSEKSGQAILVAGTNLKELEKILEATKNTKINVYTYGQMITAHCFPKFKSYSNLAGHFEKHSGCYISDFSLFPGPIFLTKLSLFKPENLFTCKIYTSDKITSKGISTIKNDDFELLIRSALFSDGFDNNELAPKMNTGIDEKEFLQKVQEIASKVDNGKIKNIFIIGASDNLKTRANYFKKFFSLLNKDCAVISFSHTDNSIPMLLNFVDYDLPFIYQALKIISETKNFSKIKTNVIFDRCDTHTFTNLINTKIIGTNNAYISKCSPSSINPNLIELLQEHFDIKEFTTPENDFNDMMH